MSRYKLFAEGNLPAPKTVVNETTDQEGGTLRLKGGALIDGRLTKVTIISVDDSPIKVSALATLDTCVVNCKDIIVEGIFSGEIHAKGDVELGESCTVMGSISHSGGLMISGLADTAEVTTKKVAPAKAAEARPSYFAGTGASTDGDVLAIGNEG